MIPNYPFHLLFTLVLTSLIYVLQCSSKIVMIQGFLENGLYASLVKKRRDRKGNRYVHKIQKNVGKGKVEC